MSLLADITDQKPFKVEIPGQGELIGYTFKSATTGESSTHRFAQVPYALPIRDSERWTLSRPLPADFDYTGDYGKVGLKCPQPSVANPLFNYTKSPSQENVQYLNIFVPEDNTDKPIAGWPVLVYYHGGWLQYNSANHKFLDTAEFNSDFKKKFILVTVGYRLNIFGFLSSKELREEDPKASNFGFWDQRMGLEWVYNHIEHFHGNPQAITIGGISAGAYSTFFQLAYELYHPEAKKIIKQAVFHSNQVYVQPKSVDETQEQFDEVVAKLGISSSLSAAEKLEKLRAISSTEFEDFIPSLTLHTFRAVTDGYFVGDGLIKDLDNGEFAKKLITRNIRLIIGETDNEPWKYSILNTPKTIDDLKVQVQNYYPADVVESLLKVYPIDKLNPSSLDFKEELRIVFGDITADGQIYASERGFINKIIQFGFPQKDLFRYRIAWRAKFNDKSVAPELKVIHALDFSLWNYKVEEYLPQEVEVAKRFISPYLDFLNLDDVEGWESSDYKKINYLSPEGDVEYIEDPLWERGVEVSEAVYAVYRRKATYTSSNNADEVRM